MPSSTRDPRERDPHELSLTVIDLRQITEALDRAQKANIRFDGALLAGRHRVTIRWESDQRDGDWPVVTGIQRA